MAVPSSFLLDAAYGEGAALAAKTAFASPWLPRYTALRS